MKHKKLFIAATAVFSFITVLAIFLMIWFFGDSYDDFASFDKEVAIPGLKDGAVPQGITTYFNGKYQVQTQGEDGTETKEDKKQHYYFISAYFKGQPSRIYVVGKTTGYAGYVTVKNEDGSYYTGHCGGIATNGNFLWISSDDTVFVAKASSSDYTNIADEIVKKAAARTAAQGSETSEDDFAITFTTSFAANCNASFLFYYDADWGASERPSTLDKLYVGEFYRKGNYETDETHRVTSVNGKDDNKAFAYEYSVSNTSENTGLSCLSLPNGYTTDKGADVPRIQKIFSLPNEIQGFARTSDNTVVLSQSYGLKNSHLLCYHWDDLTATSNGTTFKTLTGKPFYYAGVKTNNGAPVHEDLSSLNLTGLKVYFFDSQTLLKDYSIPSMSEGLCVEKDRVFVLFESGSKKYKMFVRQILTDVHSFVPQIQRKNEDKK